MIETIPPSQALALALFAMLFVIVVGMLFLGILLVLFSALRRVRSKDVKETSPTVGSGDYIYRSK